MDSVKGVLLKAFYSFGNSAPKILWLNLCFFIANLQAFCEKLYLILFKVTLLSSVNEHQLNYQNFCARRQVVPGDGGTEEGGVRVNLFRKENPIRSKGDGRGTFMFAK